MALQTRSEWITGSYAGDVTLLLKIAENNPIRNQTGPFGPQIDSVKSLFIGYGYDLIENRATAVADLTAAGAVISDPTALQNALNALQRPVLAAARNQIAGLVNLSQDAASNLLQQTIATKEAALTDFLTNTLHIADIPQSNEREALMSLFYNGGEKYFLNHGNPNKLSQALQADNRAAAWFEIRYRSAANGGGIVARRYVDSQLFGLYANPTQATATEALQAYQVLTQYRSLIMAYEETNGTDPFGANPATTASAIKAANTTYGLGGTANAVQTLAQIFDPAAQAEIGVLQDQYANVLPHLGVDDSGASGQNGSFNVRSVDIFMASGQGQTLDVRGTQFLSAASDVAEVDADHILVGIAGGDSLVGGLGDDILIAQFGNETLQSGSGTDTLIASAGNDVLRLNGFSDVLDFTFSAAQGYTETVIANNPAQLGDIYVEGNEFGGQVMSAVAAYQWTDSAGDLLRFVPNPTHPPAGYSAPDSDQKIGELQIQLGGAGGNEIDIWGFNLSAAESKTAGFLGITLPKSVSLTAGSNAGVDPPAPAFVVGSSESYTVWVDSPSTTAQIVTMTLSGVLPSDFALVTGSGAQPIDANGTFQVTIPAGEASATFSLANIDDLGSEQVLQLTASVTDPNTPDGTVSSTPLTQNYVEAADDPFAQGTAPTLYQLGQSTTSGGLPYTVYSDEVTHTPVGGVSDGNNYILLSGGANQSIAGGAGNDTIDASFGQVTTGGALIDGGVDVITGNGGNDFILAGSPSQTATSPQAHSDLRIYAGSQVDLDTAILDANSSAATGEQGDLIVSDVTNATIVGSNGNDLIIDSGNDLVVAGPGDETIVSGVVGVDDELSTFNGGGELLPTPGQTWSDSLEGAHQVFFSDNLYDQGVSNDPPTGYEGNLDDFDDPFLTTNATIFGGSGNDLIELSNGNNDVELGTGDSTVFGGMGQNTIIGGGGVNSIVGGGGSDYIELGNGGGVAVGAAGDNTIFGGAGNDTLYAGSQFADWATAELGANYVEAGSGNTLIEGSGGNDTLIGGSGNNTIEAGAGNEYVLGGSGDESINGGAGNDTLIAGGSGNDTIWAGTGSTTIYGGDGPNLINGGSGANVIYTGDGGTADAPTTVWGGAGETTIYGGDGVDHIHAGNGDNVIYAGDGGTVDAPTLIWAGSGNTTIYGGDGFDEIVGGSGTDVLYAGDGGTDTNPNYVVAGSGLSTLYGGAGVAQLQDSLGGSDLLQAGSGDTTLVGIGADTLVAGSGTDLLEGSGNVTYDFNTSDGEAQLSNSGGGTLEFSADQDPADMTVSAGFYTNGNSFLLLDDGDWSISITGGLAGLSALTIEYDDPTTMSLDGLVQQADAAGNAFDTTLAGANGNLIFDTTSDDSLAGGTGSDTISAWGDNDTLVAGTAGTAMYSQGSNAVIDGGAGTDTLEASGANSTLVGGAGNETFEVDNTSDVVLAQDEAASNTLYSSVSYTLPENVDVMTLTGNANLVAYGNDDFANVITANSGNDTLHAGSGQDTLVSGTGVDMLLGGTGNDTFIINNSSDQISFPQWAGNDTIYSSVSYNLPTFINFLTLTGSGNLTATDDYGYGTLTGNAGNDTLIGGSGFDTLVAGTGVDTLVTGTGSNTLVINNVADVVEVSAGAGSDTVESSVSFTLQQGLDTLQLLGNANVVGGGNGDQQNVITGNAGNDTLIAGSGSDTLVAGTGIDTLIAGSGHDLLQGSGGDTFVLGGSGSAEIQVARGSGTIQFGAGVTAADLNLSLGVGSDGSPALLISGDGLAVTVDGGWQGSIGDFDFADGSQLTLAQLLAAGHVQSSTLAFGNSNFVLDVTPGDSLQGGTGNDTLVGTGAGDTIVAGSGNQALAGYGAGDVLVGGVGDDSLYGSGGGTLAAGSGTTTLYGGPGSNTYLLTQGGTATLYTSSAASGAQTIFLPPGLTAADFSSRVSPNGDLILQSNSGDTLAVIRGFYSSANANTAWILADQSGNAQLLRDWVSSSQGSTGGGGGSGVAGYEAEVQGLLSEFQANLSITLNQMGQTGTSILSPTRPSSADQYTFTGVTTQNLTVQGGSLQVGPSASDQSKFVVTGTGTRTSTYTTPVYSSYTIPSSITFVPVGDSDLVNLDQDGNSLPTITVNGQTGYAYYTPPETVTVQTGTQTVTTTYPVTFGYSTETQGFTEYNITGDGGSDVINAAAPFLGTVVTGDGNNVSVDLGIDDGYWDQNRIFGHVYFPAGDSVAPGAFIDVGNGVNDTIQGTGDADVIAAGLGFDYIIASMGSTVYVPMEGAATDIIATVNEAYYGSGPLPKNTLVLPEGVTTQDLQVKVIDNPNIQFGDPGFDPSFGNGAFIQLTYGDSTVLLEYNPGPPLFYLQNADSDDTDGINRVQFADGTILTRSQLLAMAGAPVEVDDTYNPVITQLAQNVVANTLTSAADLFAGSDMSGSSIRLYQVSNSSTSGAYFSLNGTVYSPGQEFQVDANQLTQLQYIPGAMGSTDTLTVTGFDGYAFGQATNLSLSVVAPDTPMMQTAAVSHDLSSAASNSSYSDTVSLADGSSDSYWWNATMQEYQAQWVNGDGSYSTDDYKYAAGGSPGSTNVSFVESYSDSNGDQGTRQYDATTGVTSLSWYSAATGTLTGTTTDSGFVGLQNDGESANAQHDPSFFNPAVSPSFQSFLAGH